MNFIFSGFKQINNVRRFSYEAVAEDSSRRQFVVGADLLLIRKYQITMQELPLLCLHLLETSPDGPQSRTFTEDDMRTHAGNRWAAREIAAAKRKPVRRPPSSNMGAAWRGPASLTTPPGGAGK